MGDRRFDQSFPQVRDDRLGHAERPRFGAGVGDDLRLARFVAHRGARRFDAGGSVHIGEAAREQRDQLYAMLDTIRTNLNSEYQEAANG